MNYQDLTQMPPTGEDPDDAAPEFGGWSAFGAVLLVVGFVVHMTHTGISHEPTSGSYWRLQFFFVLLAGVAITGMALAALTCMMKSKPKPPGDPGSRLD
jgi:hypothetical protein